MEVGGRGGLRGLRDNVLVMVLLYTCLEYTFCIVRE